MVQRFFIHWCLLGRICNIEALRFIVEDLKRETLPTPLTAEERLKERGGIGFAYDLLKMKDKSYTATFCSRSDDNCATVDGYPGGNSHSELTFEKIVQELPMTPGREINGSIRRLGDLGYFIFNPLLWEEDWKAFPIGADIADHRKHRPTADLLMGSNSPAWNRDMIRKSVKEFFHKRKALILPTDLDIWNIKILHKILLDMNLSDIEAADFASYKADTITISVLPILAARVAVNTPLGSVMQRRNLWIEKYEAAMSKDRRNIIPRLQGRDQRFLADLLLTTMTSAGGLSIPTVLHISLAVLYGKEKSPLPEAKRKLTEKNIEPWVLEVIRRYPAVVGFPWWSPDQSERTVLNLAMALRDPRAWSDPETFKLRPLKEYHKVAGTGTKVGVAWAEQAQGYAGLSPDSRGCPAKELSLVLASEFLRGLLPTQAEWVVTESPQGGIQITEGPSTASSFTLTRWLDVNAAPDIDQRSEEIINYWPRAQTFQCPIQCESCCHAISQLPPFFKIQDENRFKCIIEKKTHELASFKIAGRQCTRPKVMKNDPTHGKTICDFTRAEQALKSHADLLPCGDKKYVVSFEEFLGSNRRKSYCSVTYTGSFFNVGAVGMFIDLMYFDAHDHITGGACDMKAREFLEAGLLQEPCKQLNITSDDKCENVEEDRLCKRLQTDEDAGRLDTVGLAMWAGAVGKLRVESLIPKPVSAPHKLRKFGIPGWAAKTVSYESPRDDKEVPLQGGALMCFIKKVREKPINDELDAVGRNDYLDKFDAGAWSSGALVPRTSADVLTAYFDRYGIYQAPLHFKVPPDELLSDRTLTKLVFESIGAHHVEFVEMGKATSLNPISINGVPVTLPHSFLDALPSAMQKKVRFLVRMEGIFDQVPVREGLERWGGNAFFNSEGTLMALQYRGETVVAEQSPEKWETMKFVFRSSLVSTVTAFDHLVTSHILAAETLAIACVETLPAHHGLRTLLTPHIRGSLAVNFQASTNLFAKGMLVHRASPYADEAFLGADGSDGKLWQMIGALRYTKFMDRHEQYMKFRKRALQSSSAEPEIPLFEDGALMYKALNAYITSFVTSMYGQGDECSKSYQEDERAQAFVMRFFENNDAATPNFWPDEFRAAATDCDALIMLLSEVVFIVTGFHRHSGSVADFFRTTSFVATMWKKGETEARPKQSMLMMLLAATTNAVLPKLNQRLTDIYDNSSHTSSIFEELFTNMQAVQVEIEARNRKRAETGHLEFHQMEPKYVEWSVSV